MSAETVASETTAPAPIRPSDRARYIVWGTALVASTLIGIRAMGLDYDLERAVWLSRGSGWCAAGALLLSLSMTPLGRVSGHYLPGRIAAATWPSLRRQLGIASAIFALAHAAINVVGYLDFDWDAIVTLPYLRAGLVALAILLPLLVTSFPRLTRGLGVRLWKPLHRLAYVAALFAFQHTLLAPFPHPRLTTALFLTVAVIGLIRFAPKR